MDKVRGGFTEWGASSGFFFISYARENADAARSVMGALQQVGLRVWFDEELLHRNAPELLVSERIWDTLASATDFVALVSRDALRKPWVLHEWQTASARWLAAGAPRIHVVVLEQGATVPEIPFVSLTRFEEAHNLARSLALEDARVPAPGSDAEWDGICARLRAEYLMGGATAARAVHQFDALWPLLRERMSLAAANAFEGLHAAAIPWLRSLGPLLDLRVDRQWLVATLTQACDSAGVDARDRAMLQNNLGVLHAYRGEWAAGEHFLRRAIAGCEQLDDVAGTAVGFSNLALIALESGRLAEVMENTRIVRQVLAAGRSRASTPSDDGFAAELASTEGLVVNHEGCVAALRGDYDLARQCFSEHLAIAEILEHRRFIAVAMGRLAWTDILQQRTSWRTRLSLNRYRTLSVATLNPRGAANAAAWEAQLCLQENDPQRAASLLREELGLRELLHERVDACRSLAWSLIAADMRGERDEAERFAVRLRTLSGEIQVGPHDTGLIARALAALDASG
jgi:hypothetical protein